MTTIVPTRPSSGPTLASERLAPTLVPRILTSFDLVAILVAVTLFINNAAAIQPAGPAAFGWWGLGFALFFVPSAIVTGRLGRLLPAEGSVYLWTHRALGRFWGFFAGYCAWWPGVLVLVALGPVVLGYLGYVLPSSAGSWDVEVQGLVIVAIVLACAVVAVQRFRAVQTLVNVTLVGYGLGIVLVVAAGAYHLATGHHPAVDPAQLSAYRPSAPGGLNTTNWTFFGLVVLALLGVEVPLNMGAEITRRTAVARHLKWGCVAVMIAYLLATWAVMVTVPRRDALSSAITPLPETVTIAFGRVAGDAVAVLFAVATIMIAVVYNYAFSRLLFVSGLDRRLPEPMARLNRHRVPANAIWTQTAIAVTVALATFVVLPVLGYGGSPADIQTKVYDILEAGVTVIWCLSMVFLFIDGIVLTRRSQKDGRVATGRSVLLWLCSTLGVGSSLVAVVATLSGSWTPLIGNDGGSVSLFDATVHWGAWSWWVLAVALGSLLVGAALYVLGERIQREADARMRVGSLHAGA